jgi:hypothetical protein
VKFAVFRTRNLDVDFPLKCLVVPMCGFDFGVEADVFVETILGGDIGEVLLGDLLAFYSQYD